MTYSKRIWEQPATRVPEPFERSIRVIFDKRDGVEGLTVATSFIAPHGCTDRHVHGGSGELMYIMSGRGRGVVGDESFTLEPEVIFWAPAGVEHQLINTSDETLKVLAVYSPPVSIDFVQQAVKASERGGRSNADE